MQVWLGVSLVRGPYCQLGGGSMCFYIGTAQLKKVLGWAENRTSNEVPDSICWGSSFGPSCKGNAFKKGSESGPPWNQKRSPPWRVQFSASSLWQICWSIYFKLKLIWPATAASGSLNWGGPFLHACFFLRFEDQKRAPSLSYCFASISIGLRPEACFEACLEACPEVFCSNFHGLATLEFETCIEACLQLCFIL